MALRNSAPAAVDPRAGYQVQERATLARHVASNAMFSVSAKPLHASANRLRAFSFWRHPDFPNMGEGATGHREAQISGRTWMAAHQRLRCSAIGLVR